MTDSQIRELVGDMKLPSLIRKTLDKAGIKYEYEIDERKMFSFRIPNDAGYVRIYNTYRGEIRVWQYSWVKYEYSGIPTFEPSRRRSI